MQECPLSSCKRAVRRSLMPRNTWGCLYLCMREMALRGAICVVALALSYGAYHGDAVWTFVAATQDAGGPTTHPFDPTAYAVVRRMASTAVEWWVYHVGAHALVRVRSHQRTPFDDDADLEPPLEGADSLASLLWFGSARATARSRIEAMVGGWLKCAVLSLFLPLLVEFTLAHSRLQSARTSAALRPTGP